MKTTYMYGVWDLTIQKFVYIGKSISPCGRFKDHMRCSGNVNLRKLVKEKGVDSFGLIILEKTSFFKSRDWVKRERFWVKKFRGEGHPLCNKNDGGGGSTEVSKETRVKISETLTGHEVTKETRAKISKTKMGHEVTEEARAKQSKAMSGENNPNYGKPRTEKAKTNISKALIGRKLSEEHCMNISISKSGEKHPNYGKPRSKEVKAKISKALMGHDVTEEQRARMSMKRLKYFETHDPWNKGKKCPQLSGENNGFYGKSHTEEVKDMLAQKAAKDYPAFYNEKTVEFIPEGINLTKICRERNLTNMSGIRNGFVKKNRDGWRLATALEIATWEDNLL